MCVRAYVRVCEHACVSVCLRECGNGGGGGQTERSLSQGSFFDAAVVAPFCFCFGVFFFFFVD